MEQNKEQQPTIEEVLEKHMEDRPSKIIEESYLESVYDAMQEWASIETEQLRQENKTLIQRIKELEAHAKSL